MKISIIGASGVVGSATAFTVAGRGLADEIVMLGTRHNILASHAMDIQASITGEKDMVIRSGGYEDITASDIVIITAGVHFPVGASIREKLAPNIPIIKKIATSIKQYCPRAVIITVTNPVDLLNYAVYLIMAQDRGKLIGFNTNDSTRFRMALSKALGVSATRIEGLVIGEHPQSPLPLFSSVRIDGQAFKVDEDTARIVQQEITGYLHSLEELKAGRSAGWTTAAGLTGLVQAITADSGSVLPCSAVLDGEYGYRGFSMGVPAVIGKSGIRQILEWELTDAERTGMNQIAHVLQQNSELVRHLIGLN